MGFCKKTSVPETAEFLDKIKDMGFNEAFKGGLSFSLGDIIIPDENEHDGRLCKYRS